MFYQSRREIMQSIRARGNKTTELALIAIFREFGITGWRRHVRLPGRPDFVFPRQKLAIFVDGCFWHGCPRHSQHVNKSGAFWIQKIRTNKSRDRRNARALNERGWTVLRLWEHELSVPNRRRLLRRLSQVFGIHAEISQ
ncbi:MAG: very short patch repair endonuclease [Verrucomicrobia bacterium]|nr:very short patch repair endonuclease [Verrucomicrobiota bacterium]